MDRRTLLKFGIAFSLFPKVASATNREVWSAPRTAEKLEQNAIKLIDVRSRQEWLETGVAKGAWPISLHEPNFQNRLFLARELSAGSPIALICATGGRSGRILKALKQAGYTGFIDVSEGMLGSYLGPGWIARGLPLTDLNTAITALPMALR
jgi:rhodanese-related sulfurtransferase